MIASELAGRLGQAVGMGNILVHEYAEVDLDVVTVVLQSGLADLQAFGATIGSVLSAQPET